MRATTAERSEDAARGRKRPTGGLAARASEREKKRLELDHRAYTHMRLFASSLLSGLIAYTHTHTLASQVIRENKLYTHKASADQWPVGAIGRWAGEKELLNLFPREFLDPAG